MMGGTLQVVDSGYLNLHFKFLALPQGSANYGLGNKSVLLPVLVNKVSLQYTHTYLFMGGLQYKIYSLSGSTEKKICQILLYLIQQKDLKQLTCHI